MVNFSAGLLMFLMSVLGEGVVAQAPALTFTENQIDRYVAAVRAIERKREEVLRRAKNSENWAIAVQLAETHNRDICRVPPEQQPANIQVLCRELLEFSEREIRRHGLTNREFNQITQSLQQDKQLQARIQLRLLKLRNP